MLALEITYRSILKPGMVCREEYLHNKLFSAMNSFHFLAFEMCIFENLAFNAGGCYLLLGCLCWE